MKMIMIFAAVAAFSSAFAEGVGATVTVDLGEAKCAAAKDLWGIFFEDIDLSLDGGVYAEMVRNRSFEDGNGKGNELTLEYWNPVGGAEYFLANENPVSKKNRNYLVFRGEAGAGVANEGYFGYGIEAGKSYELKLKGRVEELKLKDGVEGGRVEESKGEVGCTENIIEIALERYNQPPLAMGEIKVEGGEWKDYAITLTANDTDTQARLVFRMKKAGEVALDCVSLFPTDAVAGLFRRDLIEKLRAIKPSFMRFPGGCWVEGKNMKEAYRWKDTIGSMWDRRTQWNCWKYWSTNGVGFHEYLLLAEALGAKPLFCINVGMSHEENVPMEKMGEFVQDALDCIEYANGPVDSVWGAKRAAAGHPEPFGLAYLEIGNENGGPEYEKRYKLIADAVAAKYPEVTLVFDNWKSTKKMMNGAKADLRDDHFYKTPDAFMGALAHEYDAPKGDFGIFVGEYAVTKGTGRYGSLRAAIGEAAFMLGLERNQDQVKLAAYAPLFANAQHTVWTPNLIYPMTLGSFVNPSWNVQKLFSENRGDEVLKLEVATEKFTTVTTEPWTKGSHTNEIAKVQASAVREKDGAVILKLVNCTESEQEVGLRFIDSSIRRFVDFGREVKRVTFTGESADAHNSPAKPEALKEVADTITLGDSVALPPLSLVVLHYR